MNNLSSIPARTAFLLWACFAGIVSLQAQRLLPGMASGNEVLVIYNSAVPESKAVAEHYAAMRHVPSDHLLGLTLPNRSALTRPEYRDMIQEPLLKELPSRKLASWSSEIVPMQGGKPGAVKYKLNSAQFRYIALCFGVPWVIHNDPDLKEDLPQSYPESLRRNDASVDSELTLLPILGNYRFTGGLQNPFASVTNESKLHPVSGIFMVTRLDGPTPELASHLVDKAIEAETHGLWGNAYIDLRGITNGNYALGDTFLTNAATVCKHLGFTTYVDNQELMYTEEYPLNQIAIYMGWYAWNPTGAWALPTAEFMPGAIAYHLHSFSAADIRSPTQNWVGPLIAKGATATMGCVQEPYLAFTPDTGILMDRLGNYGFTFGEASFVCQPFLSWQTVAIGDPLYRPFGRTLGSYGMELHAENNPLAAWADTRQLNIDVIQGRSLDSLIQLALKSPLLPTNSVAQEVVARLYYRAGRLKSGIEWMEKSVRQPCSPLQLTRNYFQLAEWQSTYSEAKAAVKSLDDLAAARPDYPGMLNLRRRQLEYARDGADSQTINRIQAEVDRLSAASGKNP